MLPEAALHYTSIAFTRGGAPAPALMSSPTVGGHLSAAAPRAALRNVSIEKGEKRESSRSTTSSGTSLRKKAKSAFPTGS